MKTISRSRTATLRRSGEYMHTVTVQFAVGLEDIAWAATVLFVVEDEKPKAATARKRLWEKIEERLKWGGPLGCDCWDDLSEDEIEQGREIARKYFPELAQAKVEVSA